MENIVAVAMINAKGTRYYFLTWGRIFDVIDEAEIVNCVRLHANKCDVKKPIKAGYLCWDLQEASQEMYFYEAFYYMTQKHIPSERKSYEKWKKKIAKDLKLGKEVYYLGNPNAPFKKTKPPVIKF